MIEPTNFGAMPDGAATRLYTLENEYLRVRVTEYGGRLVSIEAPDRAGKRDHVLLGFDNTESYVKAGGSFGALLGRSANRIGNGRFTLDGKVYELSKNENGSTLHGGQLGFDDKFWKVENFDEQSIALALLSPDGDQGFPGEVAVRATYRLVGDTLQLEFEATTTERTPLTVSAHPYFNLAGPGARDIHHHDIMIPGHAVLPTDARQIPTGEILPVDGTVFDLREPVEIGTRIRDPHPQLLIGWGFDQYFILAEPPTDTPRLNARIRHSGTGRILEVLSTQHGTQFYSGNKLNGTVVGRGGGYRQSAGFAIEPQGYPDAPNHPNFPSTILSPGETYREAIWYRFTTE